MKKETIRNLFVSSTRKVRFLSIAGLVVLFSSILVYYIAVISPNLAKAFTLSGAGTALEPYRIANCSELQQIKEKPDDYYVLVDDVDCSDTTNWNNGAGFEPIKDFKGSFDGRNYSIKNLFINRPTLTNVGLFENFAQDSGVLQNVYLTKDSVYADRIDIIGQQRVGALVGEFHGQKIINVHSDLNIQVSAIDAQTGNGMNGYAGGLVGNMYGSVQVSSSTGSVGLTNANAPNRDAVIGGLLGVYSLEGEGTIEAALSDSFATGDVTLDEDAVQAGTAAKCGGLLGSLSVYNREHTITVNNSYSTGAVTCLGDPDFTYVGGFVGAIEMGPDANVAPVINQNFTVSPVTAQIQGAHGFYGQFGGSNGQETDFSGNAFDAYRTGQTSCGLTEVDAPCFAVNENNSEPDFFNTNGQTSFLSAWVDSPLWEVGATYPQHKILPVAPDAPTNVQVTRDDTIFHVTWVAPIGENGRANIEKYLLQYKDILNNGGWTSTYIESNVLTEADISNLAVPGKYKFRVAAVSRDVLTDSIVTGLFSDEQEFATGMPATAPTNIQVNTKAKSADVSWDAVPAATNYLVEYRLQGQTTWVAAAPGSTDANNPLLVHLYNLTSSTSYQIRVTASNVAGSGPSSEPFDFSTTAQMQYSVGTCQQLQNVQDDLEGIYTQTANIDCANIDFNPIGRDRGVFIGSYNGNGFTIENLNIVVDISGDPQQLVFDGVGLFATTVNAELTNITVKNSSVVANYQLSEEIDSDQNGLPDSPIPALPTDDIPIPSGLPANTNEAVSVLQQYGTTAAQLAALYQPNSDALTSFPLKFAKVSTGAVAGNVVGGGTYSNISAENVVVQGGITGAVFGSVLPLYDIASLASPESLSAQPPFVLNDLQSSGIVSGYLAGGLVGLGTSSLSSLLGGDGSLTIQNSNSSAEVQANIGGGLIGIAGSLYAGRTANILVTVFESATGSSEDMSSLYATATSEINNFLNTQDVIISNSTASGLVSTCENSSEFRLGVVGGLVGIGLGTKIEQSTASGNVTACGATSSNLGLYGGSMGGIAGALIASRVVNSSSSGDIIAVNDTAPGQVSVGDAFIGMTGGVSGLYIGGSRDNAQSYSFENTSSSGSTTIAGKRSQGAISGGLIGLVLGSPTINSSNNTGDITHAFADNNVGGADVSGGIIGLGLGIDLPFLADTGLGILTQQGIGAPSHGLVINNTYNTGDIVIAKQGGGGTLSIAGGLGGLLLGQASISNAHATGKISNDLPNEAQINIGSSFFGSLGESSSYGSVIAGGLVGSAYGIDIPALASAGIAGSLYRFAPIPLVTSSGITVYNSYSSSDVNANIAGGIFGSAELNISINKVYNEGDIEGTVVGGLVGQSGLVSTPVSAGVLYFASTFTGIINSSNATYEETKPVSRVIDKMFDSVGPLQITNTYSTGKVTGRIGTFSVAKVGEQVQTIAAPTPVPTIAGGLIGFNMSPGGKIRDSYASGDLQITADPELSTPQEDETNLAKIPSVAGGLVGMDIAIPKPSADAMFKKLIDNRDNPSGSVAIKITDYLAHGQEIKNAFSVSNINLDSTTITGGSIGFFSSPMNLISFYLVGIPPGDLDQSKLYTFQNVFIDKTRVTVANCSGPDDKPSDIINQFLENSFIRSEQQDGSVRNLIGDVRVVPSVAENLDKYFGSTACQFVNNSNNQPNYFINNKVNAPMDSWNFSNIWFTRKNDYPKFVAGASTDEPGGPSGGGTNTSTNTSIVPPQPTSSTPIDNVPDTVRQQFQNIARKAGFNRTIEQVKGLKAILARVPVFLALSLPYSLILLLLVLAAMYARQALREYRELKSYDAAIAKIINTKSSINDYLAITTHYLNTPLAIMNGALELLTSLKKITPAKANILGNKLKQLNKTISELLSANQVSAARAANDEKLIRPKQQNPLKAPSVWVPATIALGLLVIANALFIYGNVFNRSPYRIAIEVLLYVLSVFLVGLAYRYRDFMITTKNIAKQQLALESVLFKRREAFIPEALAILDEQCKNLATSAESIKRVPEAKLFFNGLGMLEGIHDGLSRVRRFANFNSEAPLFDMSSLVKKTAKNIADHAKDKNITITTNIDNGLVGRIQPEAARQLVESVLDNALKFSTSGGTIDVTAYKRFNKLVFMVSDSGTGISDTKLPSLLKPFARGTDSMEFNHEGIGLNLYINKILTDRLGGSIAIQSKLGHGTVVTITIPFHHEAQALIPVLVTPQVTSGS